MIGLTRIKENVSPVGSFKMEVQGALAVVAEQIAPTIARWDEAKADLERLEKVAAEMEEGIRSKAAESDRLREAIAQALTDGKDASDLIRQRSTLIAEAHVHEDLVRDLKTVRIPAVQRTVQEHAKTSANQLKIELEKMRENFQNERIDPLFQELVEMCDAYLWCLREFYGRYPGVTLSRDPVLYIPTRS